MKFYLPTRDECQEIVKNSNTFYVTERVVEGQNVEMYDYRLASISDFIDNLAFELRGLTFIQQSDGSWKRNILLNKFFNVNQCSGWNLEDIKDKQIVRVQNKMDGSVISFCKFDNGVVRAKSKMSFESDQAIMAQEVYNNNRNIQQFINDISTIDATCMWELVSPDNQIVLEYNETRLVLLQVRFNDGKYINRESMIKYAEHYSIPYTQDFELIEIGESILDTLLHLKETSQDNIEGWVVTFEDEQMAKIKTNKYLQLHGLVGPDAFRENILIHTILNGNIDDVISSLVPGIKKDKLVEMSEMVDHKFNSLVVEYKELRRMYFNDFQEDRKKFAIKYSKDKLFSYVMKKLNTSFKDVEQVAEEQIKLYILKECNTLNNAKAWIESI